MPDTPRSLIAEWVARPENTARTVLVTVFGDTILPATTSVWLAQLFRLTGALGYSERLVRTSMTRLVTEGWLDNERIGRQSRYSLTESARRETLDAEHRIYRCGPSGWSGRWGVAFLDSPTLDTERREQVATQLGWHGFVPITRGMLASPATTAERTRELCRLAAPDSIIPTGTFEFSEVDDLVADGFFDAALGLDELAEMYSRLVEFHRRADGVVDAADGPDAFAMRTMLIHDLRRVRLRSIELPSELLPTDWPGGVAHDLASRLYPRLGAQASDWLSDVFDGAAVNVADRFNAPRS